MYLVGFTSRAIAFDLFNEVKDLGICNSMGTSFDVQNLMDVGFVFCLRS